MTTLKFILGKTVLLNIVIQLISFTLSLLLIRLLSPDIYGVIGMVVPIMLFIKNLQTFETSNSIISSELVSTVELSSIFNGKLLFSLLICFLILLVSPYVARFYKEESLTYVLVYFAIAGVFISISEVYYGIAYRALNYYKIALVELAALVSSAVISLSLVYGGYGIEALIAKELCFQLAIFIGLVFITKWKPAFTIRIKLLRNHLNYGSKITLSTLLSWLTRYIDDILIGRFFSTKTLGLYTKAYSLLIMPSSVIVKLALKIGIPLVAREKDKDSFIIKYKSILKLALICNAPLSLMIYFTCESFVPHLLGSQWVSMIDLVKVFSLLSVIQVLGPLDNILFKGKIKLNQFMLYTLITSIIVILSIVLGLIITHNIFGMAIYYACGSILAYFMGMRIIANTFGITLRSLFLNLRSGLLAFIISFCVLFLIDTYVVSKWPFYFRYLHLLFAPFTYIFFLRIIDREELRKIITQIKSLFVLKDPVVT